MPDRTPDGPLPTSGRIVVPSAELRAADTLPAATRLEAPRDPRLEAIPVLAPRIPPAEQLGALAELPIFRAVHDPEGAALKQGRAQRDLTATEHAREIDRLAPIAAALAADAREAGIIMADVRAEAEARGLLTGHETGRTLSWLPHVMVRARLRATGLFKRSPRRGSNGNLQMVWVAEPYYDARLHGAAPQPRRTSAPRALAAAAEATTALRGTE